ncbi:MAG: hypothetical protein EHM61_13280 [Acidobacteria bacterium]|nr:MAG: hypothetical protein EHM61_13280 [Acidobacteriota bacterium]
MEVNLTNPAPHIESGKVLFRDDAGNGLALLVDGIQTQEVDFSLPPGGAKKYRIYGTDQLQVGYALVIAENISSSLIGNVVFTVSNLFDLSIPDCPPTTSARVFVERNRWVDSGYAILNRGEQSIKVWMAVRNQDGQQIAESSVDLAPGQKVSGFLNYIYGIAEFVGSLEASSDSPFYILGLRQRRTGSLAALPAAANPGPVVGSQLIYYLDTGIDLSNAGYPKDALDSKTVSQLTGITKPVNQSGIKITNNNRSQAVTLHVYFLNDQGRDYFDFLMVLPCGETITFDPFDLPIPGTDIKTGNVLFGYGLPGDLAEAFPASQFGSGRFLLSVVAAGAPLDADNIADILYPNETAMIGVCGVTPINTGSQAGQVRANLHVSNAAAIAFDYLSGCQVYMPAGLDGPSFAADLTLKALAAFTRTLVPSPDGAMSLQAPGSSDLINYMAGQRGPTAGTLILPSTAVFTWGVAPFTLLSQ